MDYSTMARKMLEVSAKYARQYVKAQLQKDASNRYSLKAEWVLPSLRNKYGLREGSYTGKWVNVLCDGKSILIWLNPFDSTAELNICDGATFCPDIVLGINLIPGSIAHDVIYLELEAIAKAFGIDVKSKLVMLVVALSIATAGCAGCVSTDFDNPEDYQSPTYERVTE